MKQCAADRAACWVLSPSLCVKMKRRDRQDVAPVFQLGGGVGGRWGSSSFDEVFLLPAVKEQEKDFTVALVTITLYPLPDTHKCTHEPKDK